MRCVSRISLSLLLVQDKKRQQVDKIAQTSTDMWSYKSERFCFRRAVITNTLCISILTLYSSFAHKLQLPLSGQRPASVRSRFQITLHPGMGRRAPWLNALQRRRAPRASSSQHQRRDRGEALQPHSLGLPSVPNRGGEEQSRGCYHSLLERQ